MRVFQVDAFTGVPFAGNPAAVCLLDGARPDRWMQAVAAEMNLSETAFVAPGDVSRGLRWFTPLAEVDLCGHATLAAAHVLWETGERSERIVFDTRSGPIAASRAGTDIELDFPAVPAAPTDPPAGLLEAVGAPAVWVGCSRYDYLVELGSADEVASLRPDLAALRRLPVRGVIVTAAGASGCDFVSRFFAPSVGVDEDPVTGSAHCTLAPFWAQRLGRSQLVGRQLSARGGTVGVALAGERVTLTGSAVTVLRGELVA